MIKSTNGLLHRWEPPPSSPRSSMICRKPASSTLTASSNKKVKAGNHRRAESSKYAKPDASTKHKKSSFLPPTNPGATKTYYYSLYGGSGFPDTPVLFTSVAGALTWYLTRLIRDGVVWNWEEPPHLLKCVGTVAVSPSNVEPISIPVRNGSRLSQKESTFFSEVEFSLPSIPSIHH